MLYLFARISRSYCLRRHLESGTCKLNKQKEDDPSDDSESQGDEDDNSTNDQHEIPQSQSEFDPWN